MTRTASASFAGVTVTLISNWENPADVVRGLEPLRVADVHGSITEALWEALERVARSVGRRHDDECTSTSETFDGDCVLCCELDAALAKTSRGVA